jgi:tetratricopeptide (TPR) repeat protein
MTRIPTTSIVFCALLVSALSSPCRAQSQPTNDVDKWVQLGKQAYRDAELRKAIGYFVKARGLVKGPTPKWAFNIAQFYRKLGEAEQNAGNPKRAAKDYESAIAYYRNFLREWPLAFPKEKNDYEVEASSNMAALSQRIVKLLRKADSEKTEREKAEQKKKREREEEQARRQRKAAELKRQQAHRSKSLWAYVALGTGAAAGIVTAVLYGVGFSKRGAAHEKYLAPNIDQIDRDLHWGDVVSADGLVLGGHITAGIAAALITTSAVLFLTRPELAPTEERRSLSVGPSFGPTLGRWGIEIRGNF